MEITTSDKCKLLIKDNFKYRDESLSGTVKGDFKYSETISVYVAQLNKIQEDEYKVKLFVVHNGELETEIPIKFDGWFTIHHLILPSEEWLESELSKGVASVINEYLSVYYTDGKNIFKYFEGISTEVPIEEVIEVNTVNTTLARENQDFVSICFLTKCYINLCQLIFNDRGFSHCWNKNTIDPELIYKRDLVWMAINVIKYLTQCEQLYEVLRIIGQLHGCNGVCGPSNITSKTSGCGCSK